MHFPRNPPKIDIILSDEQKSKAVLSEAIKEFAKDFNKKYLHWSERYRAVRSGHSVGKDEIGPHGQ